mmetsp:Transcript_19166/g.46215  ORF Transcript_19166/g.46215 Transcript_19166/m.46215 type:complete len:103 (-) Transcript_19166:105-413(-)
MRKSIAEPASTRASSRSICWGRPCTGARFDAIKAMCCPTGVVRRRQDSKGNEYYSIYDDYGESESEGEMEGEEEGQELAELNDPSKPPSPAQSATSAAKANV